MNSWVFKTLTCHHDIKCLLVSPAARHQPRCNRKSQTQSGVYSSRLIFSVESFLDTGRWLSVVSHHRQLYMILHNWDEEVPCGVLQLCRWWSISLMVNVSSVFSTTVSVWSKSTWSRETCRRCGSGPHGCPGCGTAWCRRLGLRRRCSRRLSLLLTTRNSVSEEDGVSETKEKVKERRKVVRVLDRWDRWRKRQVRWTVKTEK